jgi:hypothetical protein
MGLLFLALRCDSFEISEATRNRIFLKEIRFLNPCTGLQYFLYINIMKTPKILTLIATAIALSSMGLAPAIAQSTPSTFPVATTLQRLRGRTKLPILLPNTPGAFANISTAKPNEYSVSFDFRPNCGGAACNMGTISAIEGGPFSNPKDYTGPRSRTAKVKLQDGTSAQFFSGCGAYCSAVLEWKTGRILYSVYIKNGDLNGTMGIANSAIKAGVRSQPQRPVLAYKVGSKVELTNPGGYSPEPNPINIRDRAGTQSKVLHIGYAEDPLIVLGQVAGSDNYGWYQVKFNVSGATGWVREDFVVDSLSVDDI